MTWTLPLLTAISEVAKLLTEVPPASQSRTERAETSGLEHTSPAV